MGLSNYYHSKKDYGSDGVKVLKKTVYSQHWSRGKVVQEPIFSEV